MKPPWEWIENDILALIKNGVREDHTLDYKACGALLPTGKKTKPQIIEEISKDVSAFANSAGGTIVYGVIEDKNVPKSIDAGYDPHGDITKEWLEQVINSSIKRRIDGIRINTVNLSAPGKVVYVVYIPQSNRAPHMTSDHRFYKRFNFASVPMEEYEVRDTANRSAAPDLKITLTLFSPIPLVPLVVELVASISNDAPEPATHAVIRLYIDTRVKIMRPDLAVSRHVLTSRNNEIPVYMLNLNWSSATKMPIWEGEAFLLTDQAMQFGLPPEPGAYIIGWRLSSPRMNPKQQFYTIVWDGAKVSFMEHPYDART